MLRYRLAGGSPGRPAGVAALLAGVVLLASCADHPVDERRVNRPPHVQMTGGPREGSRAHYQTVIYWAGWDDDGVIDHYEYALDPPAAFSAEEIASPETQPSVSLARIPSKFQGQPDTLRVLKTVGEGQLSFDYIETRRTDATFNFESSETDTMIIDGRWSPTRTASGTHTVYLRAMDNLGSYSEPDRLGFTAWTYTPSTWVDFPDIAREFLHTGERLIVEWGGYDPDPPPHERPNPVGYYYKLVNLEELTPPLTVAANLNLEQIAYDRAVHIPWSYRSADTTRSEFYVDPGQYVFCVRAVDMAGGVDPFISRYGTVEHPGNGFVLLASASGGRPILTVTEPNLGTFTYRGESEVHEAEVPAGTPLRVRWTASAEEYGGEIEAFRWGLDLQDLDQEDGWSSWGLSFPTLHLQFPNPGIRVLYVRVRDTTGGETTGTLVLRSFEFSFDREVLFLDDYMDLVRPRDEQHDAFWREMFNASGRFTAQDLDPGRFWFETMEPRDAGAVYPDPPSISFLGRYKLLVWNVEGAAICARTGLFYSAARRSDLRLYLAAGGKLWLSGASSLVPTLEGKLCPDPDSPLYDGQVPPAPAGQTRYPHTYHPGDFAFDFLKLHTDSLGNDKGKHWFNDLVAVRTWNPARPVFGNMEVDPDKIGLIWAREALSHCEAVLEPIYTPAEAGYRGKLDSLYAYQAAGPIREPDNPFVKSRYHNRLCAIRWHDPDPDRTQGRIMWFGFPLYYMMDDQAQDTFDKAIDWFREEEFPERGLSPALPGTRRTSGSPPGRDLRPGSPEGTAFAPPRRARPGRR